MFYIQQTSQHDCGYTVVKMLLANLNKDEHYLYFPHSAKNSSLEELISFAMEHGTMLKAIKVNDKETLKKNEEFPLLMVIHQDDVSHMVYLYKEDKKYVYYYDPIGKFVKERYEDFFLKWKGVALKVDSYEERPCYFIPPKLIERNDQISFILLILLSGISCLLGVYFISKDSYIYLPAIFFTLMVVGEILLKRFSIHLLRKSDEKMTYKIKTKEYFSFHLIYEKYKSSLLVSNISFFSSLFLILFLTIIMIMNDEKNFIFVISPLCLSLFNFIYLNPRREKKELLIEEKEAKLMNEKKEEVAKELMNEIREDSYQYAEKENVIKYFMIFIMLVITFLMMMVNKIVNVTYIFCYLFLEIYLYQNYLTLFLYPSKRNNNKNLLNKLMSMCEKNSQ